MTELCWRSLLTLIYLDWHLIPRWVLISNFPRFPEPLLRGLVSWESPGEYFMLGCSSGDIFGLLSCPFWSTVLQCGARLLIHTLNYWSVVNGACFLHSSSLLVPCLIVTLHIVDLRQYYVCCTRSDVIRCPDFVVLYRCRMCRCGLYVVFWPHVGKLLRLLAAEPHSTAGLLFPWDRKSVV